MTQIIGEKELLRDFKDLRGDWYMQAAVKTILDAQLGNAWLTNLAAIGIKEGHKDLVGELLKELNMPKGDWRK